MKLVQIGDKPGLLKWLRVTKLSGERIPLSKDGRRRSCVPADKGEILRIIREGSLIRLELRTGHLIQEMPLDCIAIPEEFLKQGVS